MQVLSEAPAPARGGAAAPDTPVAAAGHRLRLLSYNIQAGIVSQRYGDYFTQSWKHVLPSACRLPNLERLARALRGFDVVALQEIDAGSLRTGFTNQTSYLAGRAGFPVWHHQINRPLGKFAQHGIALLSRFEPHAVTEHRLPGMRGRGALAARFGSADTALTLYVVHLALGRRARLRQMAFLAELINESPHAVLMGDLNCEAASPEMRLLLSRTMLGLPAVVLQTFPSWRPRRHIDHILITPALRALDAFIPEWPYSYSDHLPIALEVELPPGVHPAR